LQDYFLGAHRSSQALVIVEHGNVYNLYLSDETGTYYSLSLEDLVVEDNKIDLEIVSSCFIYVMVDIPIQHITSQYHKQRKFGVHG